MSFESPIEKSPKNAGSRNHLEDPELANDLLDSSPDELTNRLRGGVILGGTETVVEYPEIVDADQKFEHELAAIDAKTTIDPETPLAEKELRFMYNLDNKFNGHEYQPDPRIIALRAKRREADKPELTRILAEAIREQVKGAFVAYKTVAAQLGATQSLSRTVERTLPPDEFERLFAAKDIEWHSNGTYDYLVEQLLENRARFALVVTPNVEASEAQIVALAKNFGKDQRRETHVYSELFERGHFDDHELSGFTDTTPVRLSLVSSALENKLSFWNVDTQLRLLRELQVGRPNLKVPSVLDSVTHWYSLRAQGFKLDGSEFPSINPSVRHFDLEPKTLLGYHVVVPQTSIGLNGQPALEMSSVHENTAVRLAVG